MLSKNSKRLIIGVAGIGTILTAITAVLSYNNLVYAQNPSLPRPRKQIVQLAPAKVRTAAAMRSANSASVNSTLRAVKFRPIIDAAALQTLKTQAARAASGPKPALAPSSAPRTLATIGTNCEGNSRTEGYYPPDTHGAVGSTQFVEVTNSRIGVYNKSSCSSAKSLTLAAFFGYTTQGLFDPRVVYDSTWNRWIVTADAFEESSTVQYQFIAISKTSDATGDYYIYQQNVSFSFNSNGFWDFPQLGLDQNSVLITANIFPNSGGVSSNLLSLAKARLYNGLGWSIPVFTNLQAALAPPIVLDQSASTFLVSAPTSGTTLKLYKLTNSSNAFDAALSSPVNITVASYTVPPNAPQVGTTEKLDASDSRFVNASTQIGNSLWQVHTVALGSYPAPKFYEINTSTNTVKQSGFFYASGSSYDFNASIAVNSQNNQAFVTWSATDPSKNTQVQVRASSCSTSSCSFGSGLSLFTSSIALTGNPDSAGVQRWGDYSAVTIDPSDDSKAWVVNEKINSASNWGSRFGSIK